MRGQREVDEIDEVEVGSKSLIFGGAYPSHLMLDLIHLMYLAIIVGHSTTIAD